MKFTEGAWIILLIAIVGILSLLRLNRLYVREQEVLALDRERQRATSITRHVVS